MPVRSSKIANENHRYEQNREEEKRILLCLIVLYFLVFVYSVHERDATYFGVTVCDEQVEESFIAAPAWWMSDCVDQI